MGDARLTGLIALSAACVAVAAGCGGASNASSRARTTQTLHVEADEDGGLYFEQRKLTAKAGDVTIAMENPRSTGKQHGIAIEGSGVDRDGKAVAPGQTSKIALDLKPGRYTYYCPVPGHEAAGMTGTLTVS